MAETVHNYIMECDKYAPVRKRPKFRALSTGLRPHILREYYAKTYTDLTANFYYAIGTGEWIEYLELG